MSIGHYFHGSRHHIHRCRADGNATLGNASYILVLGKALQGVFYDRELCLPLATFFSCIFLAPIVCTVRRQVIVVH